MGRGRALYQWIVFLHVAGVFGFLLAHGASLAVALRLRRERDPYAVRALLDLSAGMRGLMYGSLAVLVAAGATAGTLGHWWGRGWIWAALGLLVAMTVAAAALGAPHGRRLRAAVEAATAKGGRKGQRAETSTKESAELRALLASPRLLVASAVGAGGLVIILWLMLFKPF